MRSPSTFEWQAQIPIGSNVIRKGMIIPIQSGLVEGHEVQVIQIRFGKSKGASNLSAIQIRRGV